MHRAITTPTVLLLVLWLVPPWSTEPRTPMWRAGPALTATPVALDSADPRRRVVGGLVYLGSWRLRSTDPAFGGISSIQADGDRLTLLSDYSLVTRFRFEGGVVRDARFAALPGGFGTGWARPDVDSESLTRDPATGRFWVGFENWNAIGRYSADFSRRERAVQPDPMQKWNENGGAESIVRLASGAFVVISETSRWPKTRGRASLWYAGDPTVAGTRSFRFAYQPPDRSDPSDAVALPDGRLLVLNRSFHLPYVFTAVLTVIDTRQIAPGRLVRGRELARFEGSVLHDNFEALAVTREGANTIIWMASDDNQSILQRTLLLKFRLADGH
jgi:hypothetical protein